MEKAQPTRVLIIEDTPDDVRLIERMLAQVERRAFELESASRLSAGLERLTRGGIDAVLLDLSLPDSQGFETFSRVHAAAPHLPVIVLTCTDDRDLAIRTVRAGAQDYLTKGQIEGNLLARAIDYAVQRKQSERSLQQRNLELATLNAVADIISGSLELQDILDKVLHHTAQALRFSGGAIHLIDERTGALALQSHIGLPPHFVEQSDAHHTLCEAIRQRRTPLFLGRLGEDAPPEAAILLRAGLQSYLGAPIVHKERTLGTICIFDTTPHAISEEEDHTLLTAVGQQIGLAVENARLFEDIARKSRIAQTLLDTAETLGTTLQLDKLLERALDELQHLVPYDGASITLLHNQPPTARKEEGDLSPTAWIVASRGLEGAAARGFTWEAFPLIRRTIEEREVVIVPDVCEEPDWRSPVAAIAPVRSWLCVPLVSKGKVLGVLTTDSRFPDTYDNETARLASAFSHYAAMAIDNARLYEQTRAQLREAVLLHGMTAAISSTLDLEQMLPYIARSLCEALNGTSAEIYSLDGQANTITIIAEYATPGATPEERKSALGRTFALADLHLPAGALEERPLPARTDDPLLEEERIAMLEARGAHAMLTLPIVTRGKTLGLAVIWDSQSPRRFTESEVALGQTLSNQAAIAIQNASLFEEVERNRTELEKRAKALEGANKRLQELDRLKSQFLANMSHELRTPLNSVIGFSEVLADGLLGQLTPEQQESVENILYSGEHLRAIINDVLDLSKIEAGHMKLELTTFDIASWMTEAQATIRPLIEKKSQELIVKLSEDLPPLTADRFRIKQVLINLLSNANKFTPEGGRITLSCRLADPNTALFSVADTGIGVNPKDQEIIFEEFRQAEHAPGEATQGTGLGLAISKRLVEMHGGQIWVESAPGQGSVFSFLIPLSGTPEGREASSGSPTAPKALVIESDRQFNHLLAFYLRQEGYEPVQYYQGKGAVEEAAALRPALITLGLMLPDRDGWEVLRALKSRSATRDIPVLVISVLTNRDMSLSLGAAEHLVKPIHRDGLRSALDRINVPKPDERRAKVLIVDDDQGIIDLLKEMLPARRYTVFSAKTGAQGVQLARSEGPDLILLDLMMPATDGFELLKQLRAEAATAETPVLVLTAIDVTPDQRRFLEQNVQGMIRKTALTPKTLLTEMRRLKVVA